MKQTDDAGTPISIDDKRLIRIQKAHAIWVTNVLPALGFVAGIGMAFYWGIGWKEPAILAIMYVVTVTGLEVGFHRFFTHRSFEATDAAQAFLAISGSMCAQGPLIYWVANHRRHHKHSDHEGDPHSPYVRNGKPMSKLIGLLHAHVLWQTHHETPNTAHFAKDLLRNPFLSKLNKYYFAWVFMGLLLPAALGYFWIGGMYGAVAGMIWGGLGRIFVVNQITFSINSFCHVFGEQPFETNEGSRNNFWLAIPTFGQSWHNNHHAYPHLASIRFKPIQIDVAGGIIWAMEKMGFAWNVKLPDETQKGVRAKRNAER